MLSTEKQQHQIQVRLNDPLSLHDLPPHVVSFLSLIEAYSIGWTPVLYFGDVYFRCGNFFIALDEPCEVGDDGTIVIDV